MLYVVARANPPFYNKGDWNECPLLIVVLGERRHPPGADVTLSDQCEARRRPIPFPLSPILRPQFTSFPTGKNHKGFLAVSPSLPSGHDVGME